MHEPYEYELARQREDLRVIALHIMDVVEVKHVPPLERGAIRLSGHLHMEPQAAYEYLSPRFQEQGYTALLQEDPASDQGVAVLAIPGTFAANQSRLWLAALLFVLTVASTMLVGGLGGTPEQLTFDLGLGLAFSASILAILLAHELGHFLVARRLGVNVSYPFFIPLPLPPIGTMGAFIAMKAPPPDRRALLSIAIAGPVAGLVVAIPVLMLGLYLSEVQSFDAIASEASAVLMEGNSLLYAAIKILMFGRFLPDGTEDVLLHPVAWAGWVGLLVTALNLMPAGQLDGGHIFYALMGARIARIVTWVVAGLLLALSFLWPGWLLWAALIMVFGQYRAPLLNELTPLDDKQRLLAIVGLVIFIIVFTPVPMSEVQLGG